jgi:hypothetical protein
MDKNIEMEGNVAITLFHLIGDALLSGDANKDGLPTGVMIELPDGQVVPVSYAWYDRQRDMIRLSYEEE